MSNYYPSFPFGQTAFRVMQDAGRIGHVQTTSNAWTEVIRYSLIEFASLTANLTVYVTGLRVINSDACSFTQELGVKRVAGGNADIIGTLPSPKVSLDPGMALASMRVTESGTDVVVEVKAPGPALMEWCGQVLVNHLFGVVV